ncbi:MAG: tetratricopeptide repeat protein [Acidobacteria bacterium]|nr:tetratricopeptide repeat protein [Acidobacteriota bacterium]
MDEAEALLLDGTGDLMELARLRSLQAALRGDQRRFDECFELFDRALSIYRRCGEDHLVGRTMIKKAIHYGFAYQPEQAIETLQAGLRLVDARREPRLVLAANHNLVYNLNDCGRQQEAQELLEASRPLYREFGERIDLLRLRWLEARLARERGDLDEAEENFRKTREALLQEGIGWDVALVSLELAAIYFEQGRMAEIKTLASELVPVFRANDLRREAVAALILFQKAAQIEKISLGLIQSTISQLRGMRQDR